jgi:PAS domain S-box-containing protein
MKQAENTWIKDLIYKSFIESPIPMSITRTDDSTYVVVNKACVKFTGMRRKDIIGRKPFDLGHFTKEQRHLYVEEMKKQGFAKNIPLEVHVRNQGVIQMLFNVYQVKMGKDSFLLSVATDVSNNKPALKKLHIAKFFKVSTHDLRFIKGKLKHYRLTPRQQEIALLSSTGYSDSEIAKKLHISEFTVKDHMKDIRKAIGVHRRSELFPKLVNMR